MKTIFIEEELESNIISHNKAIVENGILVYNKSNKLLGYTIISKFGLYIIFVDEAVSCAQHYPNLKKLMQAFHHLVFKQI